MEVVTHPEEGGNRPAAQLVHGVPGEVFPHVAAAEFLWGSVRVQQGGERGSNNDIMINNDKQGRYIDCNCLLVQWFATDQPSSHSVIYGLLTYPHPHTSSRRWASVLVSFFLPKAISRLRSALLKLFWSVFFLGAMVPRQLSDPQ